MADMTISEYAIRYAGLGWGVIPCSGKIPISSHGSKDATSDTAHVQGIWRSYPRANVALATGAGWPFWVLDLDNDPDKNGIENFEAVLRGRALPDTLQQISGRGGRHYFFKYPTDGRAVKNSSSKIAPGVDVRGDGGYVVAAPSIHPETGREYDWDGMDEIEKQPVLDAPDWLLDMVCEQERRDPAMVPAKLTPGNRNSELFRVACSWRRTGMDQGKILHGLLSINNGEDHPLPTRELETIAKSVCRYEPKDVTPQVVRREIDDMRSSVTDSSTPVNHGPDPLWQQELICTTAGIGKNLLANAELALKKSPQFHGSLAFNEFTGEATWVRDIPELSVSAGDPVTDQHSREITAYMQRKMNTEGMEKRTVDDGIELVSRRNASHPVRNYLNGLLWDGVKRIDTWVLDYAGALDTKLNRAIGRRWLISAVARIMKPGCKADCCIVLGGKQGAGKSTIFKNLANGAHGTWFADSEIDFKNKDAYSKIQGVWIYELGELDTMTKAEAGVMKRFMSSAEDKYRPSYGRRDIRQPRQCVFAGTVNPQEFLNDPTGARRFWTVDIPKNAEIKYNEILGVRDQLWAEAVGCYNAGDAWYLDTKELREMSESEAEKHMEYDEALHDKLAMRLHNVSQITTLAIFEDILGYDVKDIKMSDQKNVGRVLRLLGFEKTVVRDDSGILRKTFVRAPIVTK